jgi:hypothetical protein
MSLWHGAFDVASPGMLIGTLGPWQREHRSARSVELTINVLASATCCGVLEEVTRAVFAQDRANRRTCRALV